MRTCEEYDFHDSEEVRHGSVQYISHSVRDSTERPS